jgi:hypothetical protein
MTIENPVKSEADKKVPAQRPIKCQPLDIKRFTPHRIRMQMLVGRGMMENWHRIFNHLEVTGRENIPPTGSLIIVGNHISNQDPPLLTVATHRHMIFMAMVYQAPGNVDRLSWSYSHHPRKARALCP